MQLARTQSKPAGLKKKFFTKDLLFYVVMLAFPVLQFCIFYIGVNARSFAYAFQTIRFSDGKYVIEWTFDTLKQAFSNITSQTMLGYIGTSFLAYLLTYFIGTTLALLFSYFIYKKLPMGGLFKVFLFLPSIISAIVIAVIFLYFVENAIPAISKDLFGKTMKGLFENSDTRFGTVIFYNVFISFGTSVLMYSNAMSSIPNEVIEAAKIDGCSPFREFISVVLPSIFPTISTFAITSVAAIFLNQLSLFSLFGVYADPNVITIGYYLYKETVLSASNEMSYPGLCALGFLLTLIGVPMTLLTKFLLDKYGPSEK